MMGTHFLLQGTPTQQELAMGKSGEAVELNNRINTLHVPKSLHVTRLQHTKTVSNFSRPIPPLTLDLPLTPLLLS